MKIKLPIEKIKNDILGKRYELSVVFIDKKAIRSLNNKYRKKKEAADTLSFSLSNKMGEIFICPEVAKIKAPKFEMTYENYLLFLVIHGMLHLKGLLHSDKMRAYELTYHSRYRRRHL